MNGCITQRRGTYFVVIDHGVDRLNRKRRRRWHKAGTTKRAAQQLLATLLSEHETNRHVEADQVTLGAYLTAVLGPDFPKGSSARRRLEAWGKVVQLTPDRAEGWFGLGDVLHHDGASIGEPDAGARSREAFLRAVALDSLYAAPLGHLADQAFYVGDVAEAERFVRLYLAVDPNGDLVFYRRWRLAFAKGDTATLRAMRSSYDTIHPIALFRLAAGSLIEGAGALELLIVQPAGKRPLDAQAWRNGLRGAAPARFGE